MGVIVSYHTLAITSDFCIENASIPGGMRDAYPALRRFIYDVS